MRNRFLTLGIVLFMVAVVLFIWSRARPHTPDGGQAGPRNEAVRDIVVAQQVIPRRTIITPAMVRLASINTREQTVPPEALSRLDQVIDKVSTVEIAPNTPILPSQLATREEIGISAQVPPGFRAMTIQVDDTTGVAGLLRPGDRVDVLATIQSGEAGERVVANTVVQNALVVAVGKSLDQKPLSAATPPTLVTLALRPSEAALVSGMRTRGTIHLVARPLVEEPREAPPSARPPVIIEAARVAPRRKPVPARPRQPRTRQVTVRPRVQTAAPVLPPMHPELVYPLPVPSAERARQAPPASPPAEAAPPAAPPAYTVSVIRGTQREEVALPVAPENLATHRRTPSSER